MKKDKGLLEQSKNYAIWISILIFSFIALIILAVFVLYHQKHPKDNIFLYVYASIAFLILLIFTSKSYPVQLTKRFEIYWLKKRKDNIVKRRDEIRKVSIAIELFMYENEIIRNSRTRISKENFVKSIIRGFNNFKEKISKFEGFTPVIEYYEIIKLSARKAGVQDEKEILEKCSELLCQYWQERNIILKKGINEKNIEIVKIDELLKGKEMALA